MSAYGPLAASYDALTGDVPYVAFADAYTALLDPAWTPRPTCSPWRR